VLNPGDLRPTGWPLSCGRVMLPRWCRPRLLVRLKPAAVGFSGVLGRAAPARVAETNVVHSAFVEEACERVIFPGEAPKMLL
jgi:hypothetical protein